MRTKLYLLVSAGVSVVFGLCFWRNKKAYKAKSWGWIVSKSAIEAALISLCAWKAPAALVAWSTIWFSKPVKTPGLRVLIGILFGAFCEWLIIAKLFELVVLFSVFAIDLVTGTNGFLRHKSDVEREVVCSQENAPIGTLSFTQE